MSEMRKSLARYNVENGNEPAVVAAHLMCRPHVIFRPTVTADGDKFCALYGDDLQTGIAGFGNTPHAACLAFDKAWRESLTPKAQLSKCNTESAP